MIYNIIELVVGTVIWCELCTYKSVCAINENKLLTKIYVGIVQYTNRTCVIFSDSVMVCCVCEINVLFYYV